MTQQRAVPGVGALATVGTSQRMLPGGGAMPSVAGGFSAAAGIATETDTALALSISLGLGLAQETDTALALGLSAGVGLSTETDSALGLTATQSRAVGMSTETDTALALSVSSGLAVPVGLATETDTALALAIGIGVGLSTETDSALALTYTGPTATVARPSSDVSAGAWVPSTGSDLWAMLDEETPSDADYISTTTPSSCRMSMSGTAYPGGASQVFSFRAESSTSSSVTVTIRQGATVIATWTQALTPTATTYTRALTAGEIALIGPGSFELELEAA